MFVVGNDQWFFFMLHFCSKILDNRGSPPLFILFFFSTIFIGGRVTPSSDQRSGREAGDAEDEADRRQGQTEGA